MLDAEEILHRSLIGTAPADPQHVMSSSACVEITLEAWDSEEDSALHTPTEARATYLDPARDSDEWGVWTDPVKMRAYAYLLLHCADVLETVKRTG